MVEQGRKVGLWGIMLTLTALTLALIEARCSPAHRPLHRCTDCNVVLISIDTLRADHLGSYGYARNTSPQIDQLARRAFLFEQAISQSAWTAPAHASMLTSLYPSEHGILTYPRGGALPDVPTLASILKREGYRTVSFNGGRYVSGSFGFARGFDRYESAGLELTHTLGPALSWLHQNQDERFLLFLHGFDMHRPYAPPLPYNKAFSPSYEGGYNIYDFCKYPLPTPQDLDFVISQYDAELRHADDLLGLLFDTLVELGLDHKTIIILTSDHGDEFFEHGNCDHVKTLYEEIVRVPLLIALPGSGGGKIIREQVPASVSILPTILDLVGVASDIRQDLSLVPTMEGAKGRFQYVVSETHAPPGRRDGTLMGGRGLVRSLRTSSWKLIHNSSGESFELYHLAEDRAEKRNLVDKEVKVARRLQAELINWLRKIQPAHPEGHVPGGSVHISQELEQQLKAMGYLGE